MANSLKNFMSPDFQASPQPALDWMPWENQQQEGGDLGSNLGQLKPQASPTMAKGGMMPDVEGKAGMPKLGGGKSSL